MSVRITRIFVCIFLAHHFSYNGNTCTETSIGVVVDAAYFKFRDVFTVPSCRDHGIKPGDLLQQQCVSHCYPDEMEVYDYADSTEDPDYVIRNTLCRCFQDGESPSAPKTKTFECRSTAQVWEKRKPTMTCLEDYKIDSGSTCQNYCKRIDPSAFSYKGFSGEFECSCAGVEVCKDKSDAIATNGKNFASTAMALSLGLLMTYWS